MTSTSNNFAARAFLKTTFTRVSRHTFTFSALLPRGCGAKLVTNFLPVIYLLTHTTSSVQELHMNLMKTDPDVMKERIHTVPAYFETEEPLNSRLGSKPCRIKTQLTLKVLNFWKYTSYCSLKPLWSGMGEVVPARTSPTLHPPSPPTVHQLSRLAL